jgi:hypothetical protein
MAQAPSNPLTFFMLNLEYAALQNQHHNHFDQMEIEHR